MTPATFPLDRADAPLFADGLGERVLAADATTGELLQVLRLRPELTAVPSFEFALRERTARLMNFRHAYYARVRRVDRLPGGGGLAIVSDHVEGTRLSDLLRVAHQRRLQLDTNAALCLIRQLVPAVSLLHENARDASHGLIAPERLVVTPHARLVIVEHVLGSGIEQLQFTRERLWQELRLAIRRRPAWPGSTIAPTSTASASPRCRWCWAVPIAQDEVPHAIPQLLMQARERTAGGEDRPLSNGFRNWLGRTLQLDVRRAFANAPEALAALEETLASDSSYVAAPVALETFLAQYHAALNEPAAPVAPVTLSIVPPPVSASAVRHVAPVVAESPALAMPPAAPAPAVAVSFAPVSISPASFASASVAAAPSVAAPVAEAQRLLAPAAAMRALEAPVEIPSAAPAPVPTLAELISLEDLDVPQLAGPRRLHA